MNSPLVVQNFYRDENGQATTEYILILAVMITIAIALVRDLIRPILTRFTSSFGEKIESMFQPGRMHRSPFRR